jgi:predicted DNA-binding protein (MmcQ/YjbR family)
MRAKLSRNDRINVDWIRSYCLSFPHATEDIQWGNDLLFRIGGKIFAGIDLNSCNLSFKCTPEEFAELIEKDGIVPAPYTARYHWVSVQEPGSLRKSQIEKLIKHSFEMVYSKLPKKAKVKLNKS